MLTTRHLPFALASALACALAATAPLGAQDATRPDSARLVAARNVLQASGSVEVMVTAMRAAIPAQRAATPQLPEEFWTKFDARIEKEAPQLADSIAVIYARRFTLSELGDMLAFYQSAGGRRLRELQSAIVTESSAIGQRWGARIGSEIAMTLIPKE